MSLAAEEFANLRHDVRILKDIEAVQRVKHAYFRCVDTANIEELKTLLHPEVVVHFVGGAYESVVHGRTAYLGMIAGTVNNQMLAQHTGHHPEIDILSETEAIGTWYLHGHFYRLWDMHHVTGTALYRDRYVKENGRWQIRESRYECLYEIDHVMDRKPPVTAHYLGKHGRDRPIG